MERALCPLRTEHNSIVTSVAIHCSFFSASFKLHLLCHKKMCSVSVVTTKLVSTAIDDRVDYLSKVRGKEESVYDKVVREFRELEKNADKYFVTWTLSKKCVTKRKKTRKDFG